MIVQFLELVRNVGPRFSRIVIKKFITYGDCTVYGTVDIVLNAEVGIGTLSCIGATLNARH